MTVVTEAPEAAEHVLTERRQRLEALRARAAELSELEESLGKAAALALAEGEEAPTTCRRAPARTSGD